MRVRICGRYWDLSWVPQTELGPDEDGMCSLPDIPRKYIHVAVELPPLIDLETVIHECLHAADPNQCELWVDTTARDLSRILWRLGYRPPSPD